MSAKDLLLEAIRRMPDSSTMGEIVRAINSRFQQAADAEWTTEDVTEEEWCLFAAQGLAAELADSREDIYTLEDGEPLNEPR